MYKLFVLLIFAIFVAPRPIKSIYSFFPLTVKDRITVKGVFRTGPASSWLDCLMRCSNEPNCVSYNFFPYGEKEGHCEMSFCGTKHSCFPEKDTVSARGNVLQQIRPSQVTKWEIMYQLYVKNESVVLIYRRISIDRDRFELFHAIGFQNCIILALKLFVKDDTESF